MSTLLRKLNIKFDTQVKFDGLVSKSNKKLLFDFYCYELNILIEFDGPQHYRKTNYTSPLTIENDLIKNEWCLKNNILLYRIPYSELNNILNFTKDELFNNKFLVKEINHYNFNY